VRAVRSQFAHSTYMAGTEAGRTELYQLEEPILKGSTMSRQAVRYVTKSAAAAAGSIGVVAAAAASAVAAAALAASVVLSPVPDAASRMDGVHADLLRAVQLNQITPEQAASFEAKLVGRILGDA
jgi:hypothetical protein